MDANCSCCSTEELPLEWCEGLKVERHRSRPLFRIGDSEVVRCGLMEISVVWHVGRSKNLAELRLELQFRARVKGHGL
jgi:hypothetical protein